MPDWAAIDTVLFDMDGTLLDLHFDNYFWLTHLPRRYAEIHNVAPQAASDELSRRFIDERGTLQWYCTEYWARELKLDIVALKHEVSSRIQLLDGVLNMLNVLQRSGKQLALVTNAHRQSLNLKMDLIDLRPFFDAVISSHDYGAPKEEQQFWNTLQQNFRFDPATTMLIDDNEDVLAAANHYGIKHLLAPQQPDTNKAAREELKFPSFKHYEEILPNLTSAAAP